MEGVARGLVGRQLSLVAISAFFLPWPIMFRLEKFSKIGVDFKFLFFPYLLGSSTPAMTSGPDVRLLRPAWGPSASRFYHGISKGLPRPLVSGLIGHFLMTTNNQSYFGLFD